MAVSPASSAEVFELVRQSGIHPPARLAALIPNPGALPQDPQKALGVLVANGVLTRFQGEQLAQGRHRGFRMGSYVVQSVLGRGGMGAVYLAEHQELRRKVAIKVLVPGKDSDHNLANERFLREARAAAALDHPNIVRIHDVCRHGDVPYLVMEYAEGETLQQILDRDGTIPYRAAADYIAQAASGLQHAYEKGFVHRDIKPSNLMRDADGTVKLLDMGLARSSVDPGDKLTERLDHGAVVGTADFIAPEQAMDSEHADIRADIYSLGATFYALVTGKPPYDGNTAQKLLKHQLADIPDVSAFDESLPEELAEVVETMLAKRPEDRYQTPGEVIEALGPWVANSSHVIAGVSRTAAGSSTELQGTIDRVAARSSGRVGRKKGDSSSVNAGRIERETGTFAASSTTRESTRRLNKKKKPADAPKTGKAVRIGGIAAAAVAVGAACWFAFGGSSPKADQTSAKAPDAGKPNEPVKPATPPQNPNPVVAVPPVAPVPFSSNEVVLYKLDLTRQKPFAIRSGLTESDDVPPKATYPVLSRTGTGAPPAGWHGQVWNKDTRMEFFADAANGIPAIGVRTAQGPASAMLFTPGFRSPTGACRVKIDYAANSREKVTVRFKPDGNDPAWDVGQLTGTGTAWRVETIAVDLRGAPAGFFEFHNRDESPDAAFRIRALTVAEAAGTGTPPPVAPVAAASLVPGPVVYALDVQKVPLFRNKKEHSRVVSGEADQLPTGVTGISWKQGETAEFTCEAVNGSRALGVTNLGGKTGQFAWELEKQCGVTLAEGRTYRVSAEYRTRNAGSGTLMVQSTDFKNLVVTDLHATGDQWKTATATFVRAADTQVRLTFDCTSAGEGNSLLLRSLVVHEMVPGAVATRPAPAPPAAALRELGSVYAVAFDGVPAFRRTVEQGKSSVGTEEKLPPQVSGFCWAPGATAEFRVEAVDGVKALAVTNFSDKKSGQLSLGFEGTPGGGLIAGKTYVARVVYRTANDAAGLLTVQGPAPDFKKLVLTNMDDSGGKWKTADGVFTRGDDAVAVAIDNMTVGEGNTLYIRSVEIIELDGRGR